MLLSDKLGNVKATSHQPQSYKDHAQIPSITQRCHPEDLDAHASCSWLRGRLFAWITHIRVTINVCFCTSGLKVSATDTALTDRKSAMKQR